MRMATANVKKATSGSSAIDAKMDMATSITDALLVNAIKLGRSEPSVIR